MAMKESYAFPKTQASHEHHHQIVYCHIQDTHWGSYLSEEKKSMYSTAPTDWAILYWYTCTNKPAFCYTYLKGCQFFNTRSSLSLYIIYDKTSGDEDSKELASKNDCNRFVEY